MAKNIDELVLKTSVEGAASLDALNASLGNIEKSSKQTAQVLNSFNARNIAFQIQDIAVQAEMGTSALRIFTQQAPQLLSAFGTTGAVVGALAAIIGSLAIPVLREFGVDVRNLKERTDDAEKSANAFTNAQRQNAQSILELTYKYGDLADTARQFYQAQTEFDKKVTLSNLNASLDEMQNRLSAFYDKPEKAFRGMRGDLGGISGDVFDIEKGIAAWRLDVTKDQAAELAKIFKDVDRSNPKEIAKTWVDAYEYILKSNGEGAKWDAQSKGRIADMAKQADAWLKINEQIEAATRLTAVYNTQLLGIQLEFTDKLGAAQRNNNGALVAQLTTQQRLKEIEAERAKLSDKITPEQSAELAAKEALAKAQGAEKQKDFSKAQFESYNAQKLTYDASNRQLVIQQSINNLQLSQLDTLDYEKVLQADLLRNAETQRAAEIAIGEQRRRNQISSEREAQLLAQVADNRKLADDISRQNIERIRAENERSIRIQVEGLALQNTAKEKTLKLEERMFGMSTLRQAYEKQLLDIEVTRDREIQNINNNSKLSNDEKLTALIGISEQYQRSRDLAEEEYNYRKRLSESYSAGAQDRIKALIESFDNFKTASMAVDSVWNNMSSALDQFVETGKFRFADFARSVIIDLEKIALKSAVIGLFKSFGLGDIFSLPGRAAGGPVSSNTPYIVGEGGPELFIPNSSGSIVPNGQLGGGGTTIINNINAVDAKSVARLFAENRQILFGNVEQARRELPLRTR